MLLKSNHGLLMDGVGSHDLGQYQNLQPAFFIFLPQVPLALCDPAPVLDGLFFKFLSEFFRLVKLNDILK